MISSVQTTDGQIVEPKMSASFVPDHKASMVLFLDRVYGIDNQDFLLHVLEVGFLPDMRAAASLDTVRRKKNKRQVKQQEKRHCKSGCPCDLLPVPLHNIRLIMNNLFFSL